VCVQGIDGFVPVEKGLGVEEAQVQVWRGGGGQMGERGEGAGEPVGGEDYVVFEDGDVGRGGGGETVAEGVYIVAGGRGVVLVRVEVGGEERGGQFSGQEGDGGRGGGM
jgi:hypothetical protein